MNHQSLSINHQSSIINHQSSIINHGNIFDALNLLDIVQANRYAREPDNIGFRNATITISAR
jgi:hypothetical protein